MKIKIKDIRVQSALMDSDDEIELVTNNQKLKQLLSVLEVVKVYPDTTDSIGNWRSTLKFEVNYES